MGSYRKKYLRVYRMKGLLDNISEIMFFCGLAVLRVYPGGIPTVMQVVLFDLILYLVEINYAYLK